MRRDCASFLEHGNNLNVTRVCACDRKKGQLSVDVKPYPFDVQNRIVVTLIKNVEKHDLNWLAAFF